MLEWSENLLASDYIASKEAEKRRKHDSARADQIDTKRKQAEELILNAVKANPGMSKTKLLRACRGNGVGSEVLEQVLNILAGEDIGKLRFEEGARNAQMYYLAEQ